MFKINLDLSEIYDLLKLEGKLGKAVDKAERDLAAMTYAHLVEEARHKLHSTYSFFVEHLTYEQNEEGGWVVKLDGQAAWLDVGAPARDMLNDILKGRNAVVVPFLHNKRPQDQTPAQQNLTDTIRRELKKFNVPYKDLETDKNGQPKTGLLHKFDISKGPKSPHTGKHFLEGINIYQNKVHNKKTDKLEMHRSIFTFRTASKSQEGKGMWHHPGFPATNLFAEAERWAQDRFDKIVLPQIMQVLNDL